MLCRAEYIWMDGEQPTQQLRSKTRIVDVADGEVGPEQFPEWSYDGSSTYQADGNDSDLLLRPVRVVRDPLRGGSDFLVLCEVLSSDGRPHATNTRAALRELLEAGAHAEECWVGFEQEYTLYRDGRPLGFPEQWVSRVPRGRYYCGVGVGPRIFGRELVEAARPGLP